MRNRKTSTRDRRDDDAPVPPAVERQINENLQRLYGPTLDEEIPDNLKQLLSRLKERETLQDEDGSK